METERFGLSGRGARLLRLLEIGPGSGFVALQEPNGNLATGDRTQRAYEDEIAKAREFMRRHKYEAALKSFKRAIEMTARKSPECLLEMAQAYQGVEAFRNAVASCERLIELAGSDIQRRAAAYNLKGIALQSHSEDQKNLLEAEAAFRQVVALNADVPVVHYNLGLTLMQQGRDSEGIAELEKYLALQPGGANAHQAMMLIENPRRARENYAPEFAIVTSSGECITLEDLRGKVVLLDFWAMGSAPCVASVPALRTLHEKYEKEPSFVMIAISSDSEAEEWQAFTARNQMVWPQYRDRDSRVRQAFEVRSFPTYIVIDHEGIVRFRGAGLSSALEASLEDAIRRPINNTARPDSN